MLNVIAMIFLFVSSHHVASKNTVLVLTLLLIRDELCYDFLIS